MIYRQDLDGLRAISVLFVVAFHSGIDSMSGGFVGVDVFFVISGYLITSLIFGEITSRKFSLLSFYKRRVTRLLPALSITLLATLAFGFFFLSNNRFDNLSKEVFFSSIGLANFLFAQGLNYFAHGASDTRILLHLWSIGVEEQFYFVWPILLLIFSNLRLRYIVILTSILCLISFVMSVIAVYTIPTKAYFYPQYRSFELLMGVVLALCSHSQYFRTIRWNRVLAESCSLVGLGLVILPIFLFDEEYLFPGINALWPCLGTVLIIGFSEKSCISRLLSLKPIVFLGLVSYPLYLYHPLVLFLLRRSTIDLSGIATFVVVLSVTVPLAWATYRFIETPIRRLAHRGNESSGLFVASSLVVSMAILTSIGFYISKSNDLSWRFAFINEFAYDVSKNNSSIFHNVFSRGYNVDPERVANILFVGDSLLQNYAYPFSVALDVDVRKVDTVTRGGCVFSKNVEFKDKYFGIACDDLRRKLYGINKRYDYVIISQAWSQYDAEILNFEFDSSLNPESIERWRPLINDTVEHFLKIADYVIILGRHPKVDGTLRLYPSIWLSEGTYRANLDRLKLTNHRTLLQSLSTTSDWDDNPRVKVIDPIRLWCEDQCKLHNGQFSFFRDSDHITRAGAEYLIDKIRNLPQLSQLKESSKLMN